MIFRAIDHFIRKQYVVCRVLIGLFLLHFFFSCWRAEEAIFATQYQLPHGIFSRILGSSSSQSPLFLKWVIIAGLLASLFFCLGVLVRISALLIWVSFFMIFGFNDLISQFHYHYLSIALLIYAIFSNEKWLSFSSWNSKPDFFSMDWKVPFTSLIYLTLTFSGISKAMAEGWWTGGYLKYLCGLSLIPGTCGLPMGIFQISSVIVLAIEVASILYLPFRKIRFLVWTSQLFLYVGICITMFYSVFHIAFAFVLLEFLIFDSRDLPMWMKHRLKPTQINEDV